MCAVAAKLDENFVECAARRWAVCSLRERVAILASVVGFNGLWRQKLRDKTGFNVLLKNWEALQNIVSVTELMYVKLSTTLREAYEMGFKFFNYKWMAKYQWVWCFAEGLAMVPRWRFIVRSAMKSSKQTCIPHASRFRLLLGCDAYLHKSQVCVGEAECLRQVPEYRVRELLEGRGLCNAWNLCYNANERIACQLQ